MFKIDKMNIEAKNIFYNVVWKTGERFFSQFVAFVISIVLARLLTPDDYGVIAMILVFINIADVFVQSGFSSALIQKKDADQLDFSTIFYCSALASVFIYFSLFLSAPLVGQFYNNESIVLYLRVFSLKIPLSVYNSIQHAYVSRHMQFKRFFLSTLIGTIISGIIGVLMAYFGYGAWALITQYISNTVFDTLVLCVTVPWRPSLSFSLRRAKSLMSYGWKILAADLSGTFFGQLRNLIIGRYYTPSDLAFYSKGQQFPLLVYNNVGVSIMSVLFPAISNVGDDIEKAKRMTRRSMQVITFILVPMLMALAAIATPLIRLLLTNKWDDSIPFLQILCLGFSMAVLGIAPFQALKAIGLGNVVLKLEFIKKPIFIVLLIIGVKISVLATAVTMAAYELYGVLVNSTQVKKYLNYTYREQIHDVLPYVVITAIMFVAMLAVYIPSISNLLNIIIQLMVGFSIYILLSWLFKVEALVYLLKNFTKRNNEQFD